MTYQNFTKGVVRTVVIITLVVLGTALYSCSGRMQCPAYSSYFLLDEDRLEEHFTYFGEDSLPGNNVSEANKNQFGIIKEEDYALKVLAMRTVPMEIIFAEPPDSAELAGDLLLYAEMDIPDSSRLEEQPANRWNWNVEQEYYFRRIRDLIVSPDESGETEEVNRRDGPETSATDIEEQGKKKGFFGRLFGKKKDQDDSVSETSEEETGEKKGGFFSNLFKKKDKKEEESREETPPEDTPPEEEPPVEEEEQEEDDGF